MFKIFLPRKSCYINYYININKKLLGRKQVNLIVFREIVKWIWVFSVCEKNVKDHWPKFQQFPGVSNLKATGIKIRCPTDM